MINKSRFNEFYHSSFHQLKAFVSRQTNGSANVDDIVQESYLRLLVSASTSLLDVQLKSYLYTTATNIVRDLWRKGKIKGKWDASDEKIELIKANGDDLAIKLDVEKTLGKLSIAHRSLIWLVYAEGYSHRDAAIILGIKENSVRVLLFRARKQFIKYYESVDDI